MSDTPLSCPGTKPGVDGKCICRLPLVHTCSLSKVISIAISQCLMHPACNCDCAAGGIMSTVVVKLMRALLCQKPSTGCVSHTATSHEHLLPLAVSLR